MAALRRGRAGEHVKLAAVRARPLQHLEVGALRRVRARHLVPRALVLARPLEHPEVAAPRRVRARLLVPRASVLVGPLQHLEVAAPRRECARLLVPRKRAALAAQSLQLLEISDPRRCRAQARLFLHTTSTVKTLERGQTSAFCRRFFIALLDLPPGRVHRVAHTAAHRANHREVRGIGQMFFSKDVSHDEVERQAGDGDARLRVDDISRVVVTSRFDALHRGECCDERHARRR